MRIFVSAALLAALAVGAYAAKPVPRPMENFTAKDGAGKPVDIASFKGKVIVAEFLDTTCPHCQETARMLTRLSNDFGARGFQVVGFAFNQDVNTKMVGDFMRVTNAGFPIGIVTNRDSVLAYLGISVMSRYGVPQIVVIDKKGVVRAQSEDRGSAELVAEQPMRLLIEKLLAEGTGPAPATKTSVAPTKPAAVASNKK